MLNIAVYIVFALLLIVSSLLLLVVLMQRPKNEGLGAAFGAQMTDQAFGAQTTDVLKKGTVLFGTLFMLLAFVLGVLMNAQFKKTKSDLATQAPTVVKQQNAPATEPSAPASNLESYLQQTEAPAVAEPTPVAEPAPVAEPVAEPSPVVEAVAAEVTEAVVPAEPAAEPAPAPAEPAPAAEEAPQQPTEEPAA